MIVSNTLPKVRRTPLENAFGKRNDYSCEIELCMGAWLDGCMRNESKRLLTSIHTAANKFITCRHTVMHSYLTTA